jgi:hypothetical protein
MARSEYCQVKQKRQSEVSDKSLGAKAAAVVRCAKSFRAAQEGKATAGSGEGGGGSNAVAILVKQRGVLEPSPCSRCSVGELNESRMACDGRVREKA